MTDEYNKWKRIATDMGSRDKDAFAICRECRQLYHFETRTWTGHYIPQEQTKGYSKSILCVADQRKKCSLEGKVDR